MYDHKKRLEWFRSAEFAIRWRIIPGLFLAAAAIAYLYFYSGFAEVTAVITSVERSCVARKSKGTLKSRRVETRDIDCALLETPLACDLERQGFRFDVSSDVTFNYTSPVNGRRLQGFGTVGEADLAPGDRIRIGASTSKPHVYMVDW
ncbi:hypothetical protein [Labrenzia sp. VG12]|uniref:hypothetical protein n=1 Tax=Labrenzia sp. VG12 TaxID=2021862 RepID=UPI0012FD41D3|nr:hypothetical protein [Labrenzia sp. VG12]